MKNRVLLSLLILLSSGVLAQQKPEVQVTNLQVKKVENELQISFDATIRQQGNNYKLTIQPELFHGNNRQITRPIVVMSRKKYNLDRRTKDISDNFYKNDGKKISYQTTIPYQQWMNEVSLQLNKRVESCCSESLLASQQLIQNREIYYELIPTILDTSVVAPLSELQRYDQLSPFLYPSVDYDKRYEIFEKQREKGALVVCFEQGQSIIAPSYRNNKVILAQVNKVLDMIEADPRAFLKKIIIIGLTSPEGTLTSNNILAEKRAKALMHYVGERVKYNPDLFEIINGSEDWDGLKMLVEASRMPDRWQVMEIIDNYSITGGREKKLMDLKGGVPYKYIFEHFFPQLRNAGYIQIYYESEPDKDIETINKAISMVKEQGYQDALPLLLSVKADKRVDNLIGVCYMMQGDYDKAKPYFVAAVKYGDSQARTNLDNMQKAESINR